MYNNPSLSFKNTKYAHSATSGQGDLKIDDTIFWPQENRGGNYISRMKEECYSNGAGEGAIRNRKRVRKISLIIIISKNNYLLDEA